MILRFARYIEWAVVPALLLTTSASAAVARQTPPASDTTAETAPVPFGPGELAEYQVKLGGITVGSGAMEVLPMETIQGHAVYHVQLTVQGGIPFARVDDKLESWIDAAGLFSRRFSQDQHEISYERHRVYDFFPEARTYRQVDNGEVGTLPTDRPLDDVSFLYYARTLPLHVGDTYTIPRYFKADGNPVVLRVLRKETIEVPAGTFNTIVVQPIIQTGGLFGKGGEAEVYFSDDDRRILVQLRSKVPVVGSLTLHLKSYRAGRTYTASR